MQWAFLFAMCRLAMAAFMTAAGMAAAAESGAVFVMGVVTCVAYVAASITGLVRVEAFEGDASA